VNQPSFVAEVCRVSDLQATGQNIKWHDVSTGVTALPSTTPLLSGTHTCYSTQTIECTESATRFEVSVSVTD
jgi:hypothetical protein